MSATLPLMIEMAANPVGTPIEAFDALRAGVLAEREQFIMAPA